MTATVWIVEVNIEYYPTEGWKPLYGHPAYRTRKGAREGARSMQATNEYNKHRLSVRYRAAKYSGGPA